MKVTAEVRWILRGSPPIELLEWFRKPPFCVHEAVRIDNYLVFAKCNAAGVKLREGRLEIKAREGGGEPVTYAGVVHGCVEIWWKWSSTTAVGRALANDLAPEATDWIEVRKKRWLRVYENAQDRVAVSPPGRRVATGCLVEITALGVERSEWWTLGLEAFGASETVRSTLNLVAEAFFAGLDSRYPFERHLSLSYCDWLSKGSPM